jgi:hypothetical protein
MDPNDFKIEISSVTPPKQSRYAGAHPAFYSMGTCLQSRGQSNWGVTLTTELHLVPRLIKHGAIPLLPLCAFMAWTRTFLHGVVALKPTILTLCMAKETFKYDRHERDDTASY